jgi:adenine-specific DNA-methyltransferase
MSNYKKLQSVLKEVFEIDKADLDFGIYRIMNQKREQVMNFIDKKLPQEIKEILGETQSKDSITLQTELDKMGKALDDAGVVRESAPKYIALKQQITSAIDTNALEQEVFSHLATFFKRYYKEGDFISMRRYKKDVYAIPYEGEEVKLHWANADQYYIKTSEYLKNYTFLIGEKKVHFQLKEASTEQNNNKAQGDMERRFAVYEEVPVEVIDNELYINVTYEPHKKAVKQADLTKQAIAVIEEHLPLEFANITQIGSASTEANKSRTLLEKHLSNFISRNSFDYFIHKDLGGFLRRELDFYIKNEVLFIDDINTENPIFFTAQLSKIKALKTVALKVIAFLAQIEEFQKKLWLKKKFVISTNYCITLDRIPEEYYAEIAANQAQREEWKTLFNVEINDAETLKEEPYLVLDTKFFSEEFKDNLLGEFDNLDEETDGVLINSENFQALGMMQEKYEEKVKCVYIDPPYNAKSSEIVYKNTFKHSSFLSFIHDRINACKKMMFDDALLSVAIDDYEGCNVKFVLDSIFGIDNFISNVVVIHNPRGRNDDKFYGTSHEYMYVYSRNKDLSSINNFKPTEEDIMQYNKVDSISKFTLTGYMRTGNNSNRFERPNLFYPIYIDVKTRKLSLVKDDSYTLEILPINSDGDEKTWRWGKETFEQLKDTEILVSENNGEWRLQKKRRFIGEGRKPKTIWHDPRYDASTNGIMLMKALFDSVGLFSYPKSIYTVYDNLSVNSQKEDLILDYFAGSGTTGHATIKLNREDGGKRKYILVEMGAYFDTVTKPRIQKVIYSDNWKNGKPQDKKGISQIFKYQVLESYEDALNNLTLKQKNLSNLFSDNAQEEYLLNYMLDMETNDHLFNIEMFRNPFAYQLKVTENNELVPTTVDLVETFNYLIGLYVERIQRVKEIKFVEGTTREGAKTLVIWRNLEATDNAETQRTFRKIYDSVRSIEFDQIYINGDHHFDNLRQGEDSFKVKLIEETFFKKMFNVTEL